MEWTYDHSKDSEGSAHRITFDLATNKPSKTLMPKQHNFLQYKNVSVEIICEGCTGTSGDVKLQESNDKGSHQYDTTLTVALGVTTANYTKVLDMLATDIVLDFSTATLGSVGKMIITITGKE